MRDFKKFVNTRKEMTIENFNKLGINECYTEEGTLLVYEECFYINFIDNEYSLLLENSEYKGSLSDLESRLFEYVEDEFPVEKEKQKPSVEVVRIEYLDANFVLSYDEDFKLKWANFYQGSSSDEYTSTFVEENKQFTQIYMEILKMDCMPENKSLELAWSIYTELNF